MNLLAKCKNNSCNTINLALETFNQSTFQNSDNCKNKNVGGGSNRRLLFSTRNRGNMLEVLGFMTFNYR